LPQLLASVCRSTQPAGQVVFGDWHAQAPSLHVSPPLQAVWSTHDPVVLHFCGVVVFLHWRLSGVHTPEHPVATTHALVQVSGAGWLQTPVLQLPAAWNT
jgi:hypothetical protein